MDYRRANRAFLYSILATLALVLVVNLVYMAFGIQLSIFWNNVLSELVVLIPFLAAVFYSGDKLGALIPIHKIKFSSVLLTVLFMIVYFPIVVFTNAVSMIFVDNEMLAISDQIVDMPLWLMILSLGIMGPFVEEIVFRGVILQSYQRTGRIVASIVLSSILFGLMHMNFNQFAYATAMGIFFALLFEATGSVLTSFIAHALFNTLQVINTYANMDVLDTAQEAMVNMSFRQSMMLTAAAMFIPAVFCAVIDVGIAYKISEIEGRSAFFASIPSKRGQGHKLITVPLIIAIVIVFAVMIALAGV